MPDAILGEAALDIRLDVLPAEALAADIICTPLETPFLAAARARGNRIIAGLGMMTHEDPPARKRWFGLELAVTDELGEKTERSIAGD